MGATEFENNENYNKEENVSMNITLNKTCYSPGEFIEGFISLKGKKNINETNLSDTFVKMRLYEVHEYRYNIYKFNQKNQLEIEVKDESEQKDINKV